jgi:HlyD family secretion protein
LAVQQKQDALSSAQETLADCYVRAPFDGVIAAVNIKKGDSASSGTTVATIISPQSIAEMSLNEVDAAKVKIGQKATMTFDAVEDLTLTGLVAEVDTIGTVSSGVVSYGVTIAFDTQDERVKSGMTTGITIITEAKTDILMIPNSAIKTSGNIISYVEMPDETVDIQTTGTTGVTLGKAPKKQTIEVGSSNDSYTEIISGLSEGDLIIIKTITNSSAGSSTTKSSGNSILQSGGMGRPPGM